MDFKKSKFENELKAKADIAHELFHAAWPALHLESTTEISLDDFEEIIASYMETNYAKIYERVNTIYTALTKKKEKI